MTTWLVIAAVVWSAAGLTLIARHDPKRLRWRKKQAREGLASASTAEPWQGGRRQLLSLLTFAPAVVLALFGAWPAFLIWAGLLFSYGWFLTEAMA